MPPRAAMADPLPPPSSEIPGRDELVMHAQLAIGRGSKSFSAASRLFGRKTRERVWLLYAWCRACDDLADDQDMGGELGPQEGAAERLALIRSRTAAALAGEPTGDPAFDGLGVVARECGLGQQHCEDVIAGFVLDAADWRPRSEGDMMEYCYHVAGAVGVMMAIVMGISPDDEDTLEHACDLGLAFQLANIVRDLWEDDAAGRCYLPIEWLVEADISPGQHMKPIYRDRLVGLVHDACEMARAHEASARIGAARLKFRDRWAVLAATGIYGGIARKVEAAGRHAWDHRARTSRFEKLGWLISSGIASARPVPADCAVMAAQRRWTLATLRERASRNRALIARQ